MFHVVTCAAHAAKQNAEFPLHVSALGPETGYYYMHRNALLRTNRNKLLQLDMGRPLARYLHGGLSTESPLLCRRRLADEVCDE